VLAVQNAIPQFRPEPPPAAGGPAVDLVHLARQTDGDSDLEAELLAMFDSQTVKLMARLRQGEGGARALADVAHRLRGSALAIGAHRVASAAEAVERHFEQVAANARDVEPPLGPLNRAVEEARAEIARLRA